MTHNTKRIEYIDALRGFTMMLVVIQHIASLCMRLGDTSSFHHYLQQIRMPMFFLISGFVLYKSGVIWDLKHIGSFLKKKFVVQILSTIVFFTLFAQIRGYDFIVGITSEAKYGYWFTYTLFVYFIFYSIIRYICKSRKYEDYIIILVAAFFYVINWPPFLSSLPFLDCVKETLGISLWYYFCFFLIGTLLKKHFDKVQNILDKWTTLLICILVYFLLNIYNDVLSSSGVLGVIIQFSKSFSGILIVFSFFRNKQELFTKETVLGRSLQYIGRRTLDIYLLHYFLLPTQLQYVTSIFKDYPMPVIEFTCSLIIALIVIAFCLLISNVIRLSPTLAHWLFGVKIPFVTQPLRNEIDCSEDTK